ncbi:MAG TPA: hypothetical protein VNE41_05745 [Chitinophagaceae bacterium]|nr:hypothetical protein [Chitinophagaceae bacterium]
MEGGLIRYPGSFSRGQAWSLVGLPALGKAGKMTSIAVKQRLPGWFQGRNRS